MPNNEIAGFFLSFTEDELRDIKRRLEMFGYKPDGEGLKKLVTETLCDMEEGEENDFENPTDRVINHVQDYLSKNPDKILKGLAALKGLGKMFGQKKT